MRRWKYGCSWVNARLRATVTVGFALFSIGCSGAGGDAAVTPTSPDLDGDGYSEDAGDCNDLNISVHPGATEECNGYDDDCDGTVDQDCDGDGDGYLAVELGGDDCDDTSSAVYKGADEVCDGLDNNCDELIDNALDRDGDGYPPCDENNLSVDCNDSSVGVYPGAVEVLDGHLDDCDDLTGSEQVPPEGASITFTAEYLEDFAGTMVASAGDVNGDGVDDLLISAPFADGGKVDSGKIYLFFGGRSGAVGQSIASAPDTLELSYADMTFRGVEEGAKAGAFIAGLGDVSGDGIGDLWIGAPDAADGAGTGYLILGRTEWSGRNMSLADADAILVGIDTQAALQTGAGGDVNGDGINDLLIGVPGEEGGDGAVYLMTGGSSLVSDAQDWSVGAIRMGSSRSGAGAGFAIVADGDMDGDGIDDLAIGGPDQGVIWILFGRVGDWDGSLELADVTIEGSRDVLTGASLSLSGDLNNDGYGDLVIGEPGDTGASGATYVFFGKPSALAVELTIEAANLVLIGDFGAQLGASVSAGQDMNGDNIDDLVIGAPGAGMAYLVLGWTASSAPSDGLVEDLATASFVGDPLGAAGSSVALLQDVDEDTAGEWLVGEPNRVVDNLSYGGAYLLAGYR